MQDEVDQLSAWLAERQPSGGKLAAAIWDAAKSAVLRDGRFYELPEGNNERLDLAVLAHHLGSTRTALDVEEGQAKRAVVDAHVLELLRPDLLER